MTFIWGETALPLSEADLLQKINHGLPSEVQPRYDALNEKLHNQTITPDEHQELLKLIDITERADAERLHYLMALSHLRQVPLNELMGYLGLTPPPVHG